MIGRSKIGAAFVAIGAVVTIVGLGGTNAGATNTTAIVGGASISSANTPTEGPNPSSCVGNEWHWVVTSVSDTDGGDPTSADVPTNVPNSIQVTWSDNLVLNVPFDKTAGPVLHYLLTPAPASGHPVSATITFPVGTRFDSIGNFNLSHGPCTTTTTTEAATTTTEAATTTTEVATTTTNLGAGANVPTSTAVVSLPVTGSSSSNTVILGLLAMCIGGLMMAISRRPRIS